MVSAPATGGVRPFLQLIEVQALRGAADRDLLRRFAAARDEAAFRVIAERHGPMVFGVCARLLGNRHDAEDALQATFLVFARRAGLVRNSESLASWLHGVARRVAGRLRRADCRRTARERAAAAPAGRAPADELAWGEVRAGLDEELARLPAAYREVLVLCYLEGLTRDEAGQRLGLDAGAVKGRLERGRRLLGERLTRRGIGLSAALAGAATAPPTLAGVRLARLAADPAAATPRAAALTHEFLKGVAMSKLKVITAGLVGAAVLAAGVGASTAQSQAGKAPPPVAEPKSPPAVAKADTDTDEAFIRRVSKDLRGTDPTPAEVHFFLASGDAKKRATLVDLFVKERADAVAGGRAAGARAEERAAVEALVRARAADQARAIEAARAEADLARAVAARARAAEEQARAAAEKDAAAAARWLREAIEQLPRGTPPDPTKLPMVGPYPPTVPTAPAPPADPNKTTPPVPPVLPAAPKSGAARVAPPPAVVPPAAVVPLPALAAPTPAAGAEILRVRVELAEVTLREKQLAVRELEELVKTGAATRTALDRAKLEVERAQLQLREAALNLEAARPQGSRPSAPVLPPARR